MHFAQVALSKEKGLTEFDYGSKELNMNIYNQEKPAIVSFDSLSNLLPVALVFADSDAFTDEADSQWLIDSLMKRQALALIEKVPGDHESLLIGADMTYFRRSMLPLIRKYSNN